MDTDKISDGLLAIAEGLSDISSSLDKVATALRNLGNADAATPMGAVENLAKEIRDGCESIAGAIERGT